MFSGKAVAILFDAQLMPASSAEVELSVDSIDMTTIKILRDKNIKDLIVNEEPVWAAHGIPSKKIMGGVLNVKGTMHGFYKNQASVPSIGDNVSVIWKINGIGFYTASECLVKSFTYSADVSGAIEWDMEWESIGDVDFRGLI